MKGGAVAPKDVLNKAAGFRKKSYNPIQHKASRPKVLKSLEEWG